jgi:hypothetical protein
LPFPTVGLDCILEGVWTFPSRVALEIYTTLDYTSPYILELEPFISRLYIPKTRIREAVGSVTTMGGFYIQYLESK